MDSIAEVLEGGPLVAVDVGPSTRIRMGEDATSCKGGLVGANTSGGLVWVLADCVKTSTRPLADPRFSIGCVVLTPNPHSERVRLHSTTIPLKCVRGTNQGGG